MSDIQSGVDNDILLQTIEMMRFRQKLLEKIVRELVLQAPRESQQRCLDLVNAALPDEFGEITQGERAWLNSWASDMLDEIEDPQGFD